MRFLDKAGLQEVWTFLQAQLNLKVNAADVITEDEISEICGTSIEMAEEVEV